jgi:cyclin-dependent kinase 12/13
VQGRQGYSDVQSRSEVFKPYQEEPAWGFPINRPRQTQAVKEVGKALMDRNRRGASHSGPLIPGVEFTKTGSRYDDTAIVSTRGELSTSSGLVASRTSSAKDCQDKASPAQLEDTNQVGRSSQSSEVSGTTTKNGRKLRMQSVTSSREAQKEMISDHGLNGNRIQFSGPLIVPFNNVDRMLKERDRHIQDAARRARLERARLRLEQCK